MRRILVPVLFLSLSACAGGPGGRCCPPPCPPRCAPAGAGTASPVVVSGTVTLTPATTQAAPQTGPAPVAAKHTSAPALDAEDAGALWAALLEGNARYRAGHAVHPHQDAARRAAVATKQAPRVVVLTCADSRVAPEVLFDQGMGDLFVVRIAGNVATPEVEASIEYAVEHLGSKLIVVMGHERCGAVGAALEGGELPGHLPALIDRIKPAVEATPADDPDRANHAIATNARMTAEALAANGILKEAAEKHHVAVRAAVFDLDTGEVTEVPAAK